MNITIVKDGIKSFKQVNQICYDGQTLNTVIEVLDKAQKDRTRITVDYGNVETGKSWGEIHDITGYVGRSTGIIKIPLLVYNSRCMGGGALLDDSIVKIVTSKGKNVLYIHPNYSSYK